MRRYCAIIGVWAEKSGDSTRAAVSFGAINGWNPSGWGAARGLGSGGCAHCGQGRRGNGQALGRGVRREPSIVGEDEPAAAPGVPTSSPSTGDKHVNKSQDNSRNPHRHWVLLRLPSDEAAARGPAAGAEFVGGPSGPMRRLHATTEARRTVRAHARTAARNAG